jgi:dolichyl-phosphate beta-glucosyltransferase
VTTLSGRPFLSVLIPSYNEEERLGRSLPLILDYLESQEISAEVLVVDDGSTDGTARVAEKLLGRARGKVLRRPENRGKGEAIRRGVLAASGRWVLMTDADLSTPIEEHEKLATVVRDFDVDLAIGSRALADSQVEVHQKALRETMGKTFNWLVRRTTGLPFADTQCGFKLMDRKRVLPLYERMVVDGFATDVELLFLATRLGLTVREVPVIWRNDARSTVSLVGAPPRMLLDVLRVRWRYRRGLYHPDGV